MKKKVYIETSVVSYYASRPNRDLRIAANQEITHELWPKLSTDYETYVSVLVHQEARRGDTTETAKRIEAIGPFRVLDIDERARELARQILQAKGIPENKADDALHIGAAAANGMDALITWNFAHLNNPFTREKIRRAIEGAGYTCPEICSPDELLEAES